MNIVREAFRVAAWRQQMFLVAVLTIGGIGILCATAAFILKLAGVS